MMKIWQFTWRLLLLVLRIHQKAVLGEVAFVSDPQITICKENKSMTGMLPTDEITMRVTVTRKAEDEIAFKDEALALGVLNFLYKGNDPIINGLFWFASLPAVNYFCQFDLSKCSETQPEGNNCWCTASKGDNYDLIFRGKASVFPFPDPFHNLSMIWIKDDDNSSIDERPDILNLTPEENTDIDFVQSTSQTLPLICRKNVHPALCLLFDKETLPQCYGEKYITPDSPSGRVREVFIYDVHPETDIVFRSPSGVVGRSGDNIPFGEELKAGRNRWTFTYDEGEGRGKCGRSGSGEFFLAYLGYTDETKSPPVSNRIIYILSLALITTTVGVMIIVRFVQNRNTNRLSGVYDGTTTKTGQVGGSNTEQSVAQDENGPDHHVTRSSTSV